jgi:hypothetical protein
MASNITAIGASARASLGMFGLFII